MLLLAVEIFLVAIASIEAVYKANENNLLYTVKIRDTLDELDTIVESAKINLNVVSNLISGTYNTKRLYDKKYNEKYIQNIDMLSKTVLTNSPGVYGVWFQLSTAVPFHKGMYNWYQLDDHGHAINLREIFENNNTPNREITPEEDPYYFEAVKAGKMIWSDIYTDVDTKEVMLSIVEPIYSNKTLVGVLGIDLSIANLQMALKSTQKVFEGSETYLLDQNGEIILSQLPDNSIKIGQKFNYLYVFKQDANRKESLAQYTENGIKKNALLLKLSDKYSIVIAFPNTLINKGFSQLFGIVYLFFAVLFVLLIIVFSSQNKIVKINKKLENEKQTLRTIIDSSPNAILIKDLNGVYIDCNKKFLDMVGAGKEDIIGTKDEDLFSKDEIDEINENDNLIIQSKTPFKKKSSYTDLNGKKVYFEKYLVPLFNSDNEMFGILINAFDVTKREEEQIHLQEAKTAAENATQMKSNFLANMSHEIRTPMNGVLGFIQLLKETKLSEEQAEFVDDAQKSSEILLEIINDILDFSKIEANKLRIENINFDIRSIIEDVILMASNNAEKKQIDLNSLICSDVPQRVIGDPSRIKQVLNNLVNNAIKFTQEGGVVIYVKEISSDNETINISFEIKDTGIGIEKEKLDLIFEAFNQADNSMTRRFGGTGLGLAISKKLVDLMNGQMSVESQLNQGSTFTFTIPFKKDANARPDSHTCMHSLNGTKILLVNSNPTDSKIIRYYLSEANCIIEEAHNCAEALKMIENKGVEDDYSAILIDNKVESSEEIELSRLIKQNEKSKEIPLILYTSLAQRGDSVLVKEKGFKGYLTKPIKKDQLIETLRIAISTDANQEKQLQELITKHSIKEIKFDKKAKLLLVDDSKINCKLVLKILSNNGLPCDLATDGSQAVSAFRNNKYDLILMDCQMPILDGYEATKAIREIEANENLGHIPIIAMTANAMIADREKCFKVGMDDYISKPMKIENLLNIISKYIPTEILDDENRNTDDNEETKEVPKDIENIIQKLVEELEFTKKEAIEFFAEYLESLPETIDELEKTVSEEDYEQLKKSAHKLKGSSGNLRIEKIHQLSLELETEALAQNKEACIRLIDEIKNHLHHLSFLLSN